jgi:hypothetical protein
LRAHTRANSSLARSSSSSSALLLSPSRSKSHVSQSSIPVSPAARSFTKRHLQSQTGVSTFKAPSSKEPHSSLSQHLSETIKVV